MPVRNEVIETVDDAGNRVRVLSRTECWQTRDFDGNVSEQCDLPELRLESGEHVNRLSESVYRTVTTGRMLRGPK